MYHKEQTRGKFEWIRIHSIQENVFENAVKNVGHFGNPCSRISTLTTHCDTVTSIWPMAAQLSFLKAVLPLAKSIPTASYWSTNKTAPVCAITTTEQHKKVTVVTFLRCRAEIMHWSSI